MANDMTDAEVSISFSITGLSRNNTATVVTGLTHMPPSLAPLWSPTYTQGTLTNLVTLLNNTLSNLLQADVDFLRTYIFTAWTQCMVSEMEVKASGLDSGTLIKDVTKREILRREFARVTNFAMPAGGFADSAKREWSYVQGKLGGGGGDR